MNWFSISISKTQSSPPRDLQTLGIKASYLGLGDESPKISKSSLINDIHEGAAAVEMENTLAM